MRHTPGRRAVGTALVALVAGLLVSTTTPGATAADPTSCPWEDGVDGAVYTWLGDPDETWGASPSNNWTAPDGDWPDIPNDDQNTNDANEPSESGDTHDTFVCIPAGKTVNIDSNNTRFPFVRGIWVASGSTVNIRAGAGLFVMSPTEESFFSAGSTLDVTAGTLGGRGTLRTQGDVVVKSPLLGGGASSLASKKVTAGDQVDAGLPGTLVVGPSGELRLPDRGVQVVYGYRIRVEGLVRLEGTGLFSANWGTRLELVPGGVFDIAGDGGYQQGAKPSNVAELSDFVNNGLLRKSGGSGTSTVDADYSGAGAVVVTSGQLALPDGEQHTAVVGRGSTLSTGTCVPGAGLAVCTPATGSGDPRSLAVTVPGSDVDGADVTLREDVPALGVAFDGITEISGLQAPPLDPARIRARMPSLASDTDLDTVAVTSGPGVPAFPTCLGSGAPPEGAFACVDRRGLASSSRVVGGELIMEVRYLATVRRSRWIVVRQGRDVAGPTLYGATQQKTKARVSAKKGKVKPVRVRGLRCSERCTLAGPGTLTVKIGGKRREFSLKGATRVGAGTDAVLAVKLSRKAQKKIAKASAKKARANILVTATDDSGNAVQMRVSVRVTLKR